MSLPSRFFLLTFAAILALMILSSPTLTLANEDYEDAPTIIYEERSVPEIAVCDFGRPDPAQAARQQGAEKAGPDRM